MGCTHHSAIRSRVNGDTVSDDDRDDEHEDGDNDNDDDDDGDDGDDEDNSNGDDDDDGDDEDNSNGDDDDDDREDGDSAHSRDQATSMRAVLSRTTMSSTIVEYGIDVGSSHGEFRRTLILQPWTH